MSNHSPQRRGGAAKQSFQERMAASENQVHEVFQLWGDFPDCSPKHCCEMDWLHVLASNQTDIMEHARLISSPEHEENDEVRALRRHLAALAQACQMWDAELAKEFPASEPRRLGGKKGAA